MDEITISAQDWIGGVAQSPILGVGAIVNCDIHTKPGLLLADRKIEDLTITGTLPNNGGNLNDIRGMAVDHVNEELYVSDSSGNFLEGSITLNILQSKQITAGGSFCYKY